MFLSISGALSFEMTATSIGRRRSQTACCLSGPTSSISLWLIACPSSFPSTWQHWGGAQPWVWSRWERYKWESLTQLSFASTWPPPFQSRRLLPLNQNLSPCLLGYWVWYLSNIWEEGGTFNFCNRTYLYWRIEHWPWWLNEGARDCSSLNDL